MIEIPVHLPNKSNSYRIMRSGNKRWIGPSDKCRRAELDIAWYVKSRFRDFGSRPVRVEIVTGNRIDVDGVKAVLDGIERSGVIANDAQVVELRVARGEKRPGFSLSIEEAGNGRET